MDHALSRKTLLTLKEFSRLPDEPGKQELSNGELIIAPPAKYGHLVIAHRLSKVISSYLDRAGSGEVFVEAGFQLGPDTIRQPDISVLLTSRSVSHDKWPRGAPDVVIEVISPANSAEEIETTTAQYLAAGARSVWIVYPKTRAYASTGPTEATPPSKNRRVWPTRTSIDLV